jgi:predicted dinucleotide-binding enzyme
MAGTGSQAVDRTKHENVVAWLQGFLEAFEKPVAPTPEQLRGLKLAFLPATGICSGALAGAYAKAGCNVVVASRSMQKAEDTQQKLKQDLPAARVTAMEMGEAAAAADVIFWLVPTTTKEELANSHAMLHSLKDQLQVCSVLPVHCSLTHHLHSATCKAVSWRRPITAVHATVGTPIQGKIIIDISNVAYVLDDSQWGQTSSTLMNQVGPQMVSSRCMRLPCMQQQSPFVACGKDAQLEAVDAHDQFPCC